MNYILFLIDIVRQFVIIIFLQSVKRLWTTGKRRYINVLYYYIIINVIMYMPIYIRMVDNPGCLILLFFVKYILSFFVIYLVGGCPQPVASF